LLLGCLSARILMLVVGFVGLRKQGKIQSPRDGRDAILRRGSNENDENLSEALQANQKAIQAKELYPDARTSYRHHTR
jgi:hypothetical protein